MTVLPADLLDYVGAATGDTDFVTACLAEAAALISVYVGGAEVPEPILDRATKEVGADLFHRRAAKNGIAQFATTDGAPVRINRDPMTAAYPILKRYLPGGIA